MSTAPRAIWIISDVFPPEPVTAAGAAQDIADELTRRGHDVTVFCPFPNRPEGRLLEGHTRSAISRRRHRGYDVIHTWHALSPRSTILSRGIENITYGITSTLALCGKPKPDVVYMNTWPIFAQWLNTAAMMLRGVPVICVVHDLYPESLPRLRSSSAGRFVAAMLKAIDRSVYKWSTRVTALNQVQCEYLSEDRAVPDRKLVIVHDWINLSEFDPSGLGSAFPPVVASLKRTNFTAIYAGSMTRMAGLEVYLEAANHLRDRDDIEIVLVGDGAMRRQMQQQARDLQLQNLRFVYPLERSHVPWVQDCADVLLLSLMPGPDQHTTPSKLLYYMASGKPIMAAVGSTSPTARIIHEASCGVVVPYGSGAELAAALRVAADDRTRLETMGTNARAFAEIHFSRTNALPSVCDLIESTSHRR